MAAAMLAAGLHVQPTLTLFGTPVRFSLSEAAALLLFPYAAHLLLRDRDVRRLISLHALLWAAAASAVMTYGLFVGAHTLGGFRVWALVKYAGWFALLYYAGLGAVLAAAEGEPVFRAFAWTFVLIHAAILAVYLPLASLGLGWPGLHMPRLTGLMANPNAYGFAVLCALSLVLASGAPFRGQLGRTGWEALAGLLCAGVLFSRSIGATAALVIVLLAVLATRGQAASLLRTVLLAALVYAAPSLVHGALKETWPGLVEFRSKSRPGIGQKLQRPDKFGSSLEARLRSDRRAIDAWLSAPVFGIGLATFIEGGRHTPGAGGDALQIHNTALWLLAEFGVAGLAVFAGMLTAFAVFLVRAMGRLRERDPPRADILFAGLLVLLGWVVVSQVHELMYQRTPWFILGLCTGLALAPVRPSLLR